MSKCSYPKNMKTEYNARKLLCPAIARFLYIATALFFCFLNAGAQEKQAEKPVSQIESVVISFEKLGDKAAETVYPSLYLGPSPKAGDLPMFVKGPVNSGEVITLIPNILYKGNFDLANIQNYGGGYLEIGPVKIPAHRSPKGLIVPPFSLYDTEQITITLNIKQPDGKHLFTPGANSNTVTFNVRRGSNFQGEVKVKNDGPYFILSFIPYNGTLVVN